eukprot:XP_001698602.1 predicted protein [Chlamydomonas reinhardtii]
MDNIRLLGYLHGGSVSRDNVGQLMDGEVESWGLVVRVARPPGGSGSGSRNADAAASAASAAGVVGVMLRTQISWERVEDAASVFKVGDKLRAVILIHPGISQWGALLSTKVLESNHGGLTAGRGHGQGSFRRSCGGGSRRDVPGANEQAEAAEANRIARMVESVLSGPLQAALEHARHRAADPLSAVAADRALGTALERTYELIKIAGTSDRDCEERSSASALVLLKLGPSMLELRCKLMENQIELCAVRATLTSPLPAAASIAEEGMLRYLRSGTLRSCARLAVEHQRWFAADTPDSGSSSGSGSSMGPLRAGSNVYSQGGYLKRGGCRAASALKEGAEKSGGAGGKGKAKSKGKGTSTGVSPDLSRGLMAPWLRVFPDFGSGGAAFEPSLKAAAASPPQPGALQQQLQLLAFAPPRQAAALAATMGKLLIWSNAPFHKANSIGAVMSESRSFVLRVLKGEAKTEMLVLTELLSSCCQAWPAVVSHLVSFALHRWLPPLMLTMTNGSSSPVGSVGAVAARRACLERARRASAEAVLKQTLVEETSWRQFVGLDASLATLLAGAVDLVLQQTAVDSWCSKARWGDRAISREAAAQLTALSREIGRAFLLVAPLAVSLLPGEAPQHYEFVRYALETMRSHTPTVYGAGGGGKNPDELCIACLGSWGLGHLVAFAGVLESPAGAAMAAAPAAPAAGGERGGAGGWDAGVRRLQGCPRGLPT